MRRMLLLILTVLVGSGMRGKAETALPVEADVTRSLTLARRQEMEHSRETLRREQLEQQAEALRVVERMRNLPPSVAHALAHGRIHWEALVFDANNVLVRTPAVGALLQARETKQATVVGNKGLRVGGLLLGILLVLFGVLLKARRRTPTIPSP